MPTNASYDATFQQAQFQPQFDWSSLVGPIVTSVLSTLSTSPQLTQTMRPQSSGPGQLQPQFDWGSLVSTIVPIVLSALSASPQLSQAMRPQSAGSGLVEPAAFGWGTL